MCTLQAASAEQAHTSSSATRAMELLPPLNYTPPVNCHVNIQGESVSRWPAWK